MSRGTESRRGRTARRAVARDPHASDRESGFALLIVLWTVALLALVVTHMTAAARGEARIADGVRNAARAQVAADGAVREAIFRLLDNSPSRWQADGTTRAVRVAGGTVLVRIEDEAGKIDLNRATLPVLTSLLLGIGLDPGRSAALAATIMDWRISSEGPLPSGAKAPQYAAAGRPYGPPSADFQSIDELSMVLGMTPDIFRRLAPLVTVYGSADVDRSKADPVLAQVIADNSRSAPASNGQADDGWQPRPPVVDITAVAVVNGARFGRRAMVVIRAGTPERPRPYRIVSWTPLAE